MRPWARLGRELDRQRGHLLLWVPVCMGIGIGLYFGQAVEPGTVMLSIVALGAGLLALASRWGGPLLLALALIGLGFCWGGVRSRQVAAPVLEFRYYGPIEGRIIAVDRSGSDAVRVTLDRLWLAEVPPERRPVRVRVSFHHPHSYFTPEPGQRIMLTGHLSPPGGPVEPGGFDFQRDAWFKQLGAVGYTRDPVLRATQDRPGGLAALRLRLSRAIQQTMPGAPGAFAAAITMGDRSAMPQPVVEDLRRSNLAHLLAISGLHMGLLTSAVFAMVRGGGALCPRLALRWSFRKIAAVVALGAGAIYLALSGGSVSTERAFIMVSVMLVAVLVERRAITLRAVALAAIVVLVLRPEALTGPGFQMSFAATTGLVAVFSALRQVEPRGPKWLRVVGALVVSSAVAGLATAPFAAAHFNQVSRLGLVANLLSVPVMGAVVMPAALVAAMLAPFGLAGGALWVMKLGLSWILWVAGWISAQPGAVGQVMAPPPMTLPVLTLGLIGLVLWQGRWRVGFIVPVLVAIGLWATAERPDVLVAESGGLVGVLGPEGRALSRAKGDGFAARVWLENDGDPSDQQSAAARWRGAPDLWTGTQSLRVVRGKRALAALRGCGGADILIVNRRDGQTRPCLTYDARRLAQTGSLALYDGPAGIRIVEARNLTGQRFWNTPALRQALIGAKHPSKTTKPPDPPDDGASQPRPDA